MATATKRKATAPRKQSSQRRTVPEVSENGEEVYSLSETPEPGDFGNNDKVALKLPEVKHPYPKGTPIYVFYPSDGDPIVFPKMITVDVDTHFLWKIYQMNEIYQSFEWMNKAGVPRDIQERVVTLPIVERRDFWAGWFGEVTELKNQVEKDAAGPPGESER